MKRNPIALAGLVVAAAAVVALVVAISGGSAQNLHKSVASASAINVKSTSLGKTLVDANGRTLYLFQGDKPNVSTLSSSGLAIWPAFTSTATPRAEAGAQASLIGTTTGPSGRREVTYNGHPLYYYVGDQKPGDTRGQGLNQFGALWYVLTPSGTAVTHASSTPKISPAGPASYGY